MKIFGSNIDIASAKCSDEKQLRTDKSRHRFNWASVHGLISCHYTQCVQTRIDHSSSSSLFLYFYFHFFFYFSFRLFSAYTWSSLGSTHRQSLFQLHVCSRLSFPACICIRAIRGIDTLRWIRLEKKKKKNISKHEIHLPTNTRVRHRRLLSRWMYTFFCVWKIWTRFPLTHTLSMFIVAIKYIHI